MISPSRKIVEAFCVSNILFLLVAVPVSGFSNHHPPIPPEWRDTASTFKQNSVLEGRRRVWIDRSVRYYSTVSREEMRRSRGELRTIESPEERHRFECLAQDHYFALKKIKSGQLDHAEHIYRRIIEELQSEAKENGLCDHAKLAVSTLLLALLQQRMQDVKGTRSTFLNFFRVAVVESGEDSKECACSAKVLQAYALFEMRRGNGRKSLEIVEKAVQLDKELKPVLEWKQFRDVMVDIQSGRYSH